MHSLPRWIPFGVLSSMLLMLISANAQATSCLVIGDKTALVHTEGGDRSPVFLSAACETLRLVSGKAMVSWVARDGKPHYVPIGVKGVELLPAAGAEERPANSVWAELTSKRDAQRSAYMRELGNDNATRFYVPGSGLILNGKANMVFRLLSVQDNVENVLLIQKMSEGTVLHLDSGLFQPGAVYALEWMEGEKIERWSVRPVSAAEQIELDNKSQQIEQDITDAGQRSLILGMLFEQLRLPLNMRLVLSSSVAKNAVVLDESSTK